MEAKLLVTAMAPAIIENSEAAALLSVPAVIEHWKDAIVSGLQLVAGVLDQSMVIGAH